MAVSAKCMSSVSVVQYGCFNDQSQCIQFNTTIINEGIPTYNNLVTSLLYYMLQRNGEKHPSTSYPAASNPDHNKVSRIQEKQ